MARCGDTPSRNVSPGLEIAPPTFPQATNALGFTRRSDSENHWLFVATATAIGRHWEKPPAIGSHLLGWARQDSNLGPRDYESPALTAELQAHLRGTLTVEERFCLRFLRLSSTVGEKWSANPRKCGSQHGCKTSFVIVQAFIMRELLPAGKKFGVRSKRNNSPLHRQSLQHSCATTALRKRMLRLLRPAT